MRQEMQASTLSRICSVPRVNRPEVSCLCSPSKYTVIAAVRQIKRKYGEKQFPIVFRHVTQRHFVLIAGIQAKVFRCYVEFPLSIQSVLLKL